LPEIFTSSFESHHSRIAQRKRDAETVWNLARENEAKMKQKNDSTKRRGIKVGEGDKKDKDDKTAKVVKRKTKKFNKGSWKKKKIVGGRRRGRETKKKFKEKKGKPVAGS